MVTGPGLVLDASVALSWAFADEQSATADGIQELLTSGYACVPATWSSEIANALVTGMRRGRISSDDVEQFLDGLSSLDIRLEAPLAPSSALVQFAVDAGLAAHDAEYVLLAQQRGLPLATGEARMRESAKAFGVEVLG